MESEWNATGQGREDAGRNSLKAEETSLIPFSPNGALPRLDQPLRLRVFAFKSVPIGRN
jgi:hypothetical protein